MRIFTFLALFCVTDVSFSVHAQLDCDEITENYTGDCYHYYDNDSVKEVMSYEGGEIVGGVGYYKSGRIRTIFEIKDRDSLTAYRYEEFDRDRNTNKVFFDILNGDGVFTIYHPEGHWKINGNITGGRLVRMWKGVSRDQEHMVSLSGEDLPQVKAKELEELSEMIAEVVQKLEHGLEEFGPVDHYFEPLSDRSAQIEDIGRSKVLLRSFFDPELANTVYVFLVGCDSLGCFNNKIELKLEHPAEVPLSLRTKRGSVKEQGEYWIYSADPNAFYQELDVCADLGGGNIYVMQTISLGCLCWEENDPNTGPTKTFCSTTSSQG